MLLAAGFAVFGNTLKYPFVHDEIVFIEQNPAVKRIDLVEIFTTTTSSSGKHAIVNTYWRPMLELTYRIEYQLFGLNPGGFHFVNVLLHVLNAYLLFQLVLLISAQRRGWSLAAALIFLVHPVQSEAVACISGISNLLFACFALGSLFAYWRSRLTGSAWAWIGSMVLFLLGLLTKEQTVVVPVLIVLLEFCCIRRRPLPFNRISAYFLLLAAYLIFRTAFLGSIVKYSLSDVPEFILRVAALPNTLLTYIRIYFLPYDLHYYRSTDILESAAVPSVIFVALVAWIIWIIRRASLERRLLLLFSVLWFLICLAPTSNILPIINEYALILSAEHFLYLPIAGITLFAFCLLEDPLERRVARGKPWLIAGLLVVLSVITIRQNTIWRGEIPLFERTLKFQKDFGRVHSLLGSAYYFEGRFPEAIRSYERAYRIMETYARITRNKKSRKFYLDYMKLIAFNMAHAYEGLNRYHDAIHWLQQAAMIDPTDATLYNNIGLDYIRLNRPQEAQDYFTKSLQIDPSFIMAKNNLAILLAMQGRKEEAMALFADVLKADPGNEAALVNYRRLLAETAHE